MSSEITLTPQEQRRILDFAYSFPIESNDIPALRDAIANRVKFFIERSLKFKREAAAPDYRLRP